MENRERNKRGATGLSLEPDLALSWEKIMETWGCPGRAAVLSQMLAPSLWVNDGPSALVPPSAKKSTFPKHEKHLGHWKR